MPRPASRFIEKLTKRQIQKLEQIKDHGDTPRIRHRAHAVLLSHQRTSVVELAKIFKATRLTISQSVGEISSKAGAKTKVFERVVSDKRSFSANHFQACQVMVLPTRPGVCFRGKKSQPVGTTRQASSRPVHTRERFGRERWGLTFFQETKPRTGQGGIVRKNFHKSSRFRSLR